LISGRSISAPSSILSLVMMLADSCGRLTFWGE
jgi:hypothetical protein